MTEYAEDMARLSRLIDQGLATLRDQSRELAESEEAYRIAKAQAWGRAPDGTVAQREAWVDGITAAARKRRDLADYTRSAALESVRSRRTQVSAIQSLLAADREEAGLIRQGVGA